MARTFAKFYISLDNGFENELLKVPFNIVINLSCQVKSAVIHGEEKSFYLSFSIKFALYNLNGIEQFGNTFKGKILALDGYDNRVGGR